MTQTNTLTQIFQLQLQLRDIPGLPIKKDPCGTMTHDLQTQGDDHAFAALDTLQGKVVGECHQRNRHQEFLRFLRRLDHEFPGEWDCGYTRIPI
jgi:hypothetical protein